MYVKLQAGHRESLDHEQTRDGVSRATVYVRCVVRDEVEEAEKDVARLVRYFLRIFSWWQHRARRYGEERLLLPPRVLQRRCADDLSFLPTISQDPPSPHLPHLPHLYIYNHNVRKQRQPHDI